MSIDNETVVRRAGWYWARWNQSGSEPGPWTCCHTAESDANDVHLEWGPPCLGSPDATPAERPAADVVKLAWGVLFETLHGPVPMATVAALAQEVLRLADAPAPAERPAEVRLTREEQRTFHASLRRSVEVISAAERPVVDDGLAARQLANELLVREQEIIEALTAAGVPEAWVAGDTTGRPRDALVQVRRACTSLAAAERPQGAPAYSWEQRAKDAEESMDEASARLIPLLAGHRDGFGVDKNGPYYTVHNDPPGKPNVNGRHDAALDHVVDRIVERYGTQDVPTRCADVQSMIDIIRELRGYYRVDNTAFARRIDALLAEYEDRR